MANTKKTQEMLMNSIFEVFEKMFFVFLEPLDEDVKYDMISSINFTGLQTPRASKQEEPDLASLLSKSSSREKAGKSRSRAN